MPSPTLVGDDSAGWLSVAAGSAGGTGSGQTCGVQGDGTLWCWGANGYGQAGRPSPPTKVLAPVQVGGDSDWTGVTSGDDHHCELCRDATVWCWGRELAAGMGGGETPTRVTLD